LFCGIHLNAYAQINDPYQDPSKQQQNMFNQPLKDSLTKQNKWKEESAKIYYKQLNSEVKFQIDTLLHNFHHYQPTQPWWGKDLGNYGTATRNQLFTFNTPIGMSLGYTAYNLYQKPIDSLKYYNTTRPYSEFSFMMGGRNQQNVGVLHTQNIMPNWNFAAGITYNSSEGFFRLQKANNLNTFFNTNYQSKNKRYQLNAAIQYSSYKQEENGGITNDSFLTNPAYGDKKLIPVQFTGINNSTLRSNVNNILRNFDILLQHQYAFGRTDTVYAKDSSSVEYRFMPRFSVKHRMQIHSEKHTFNDYKPLASHYDFIDANNRLIPRNSFFKPNDTLSNVQNWFYVENRFSLNGYIGKSTTPLLIEAGLGNRIESFNNQYKNGLSTLSSINNFAYGNIKKEAIEPTQWSYGGATQFYFTGDAAGSFNIRLYLSKYINKIGGFDAGIQQTLTNAPYTYTNFSTNYFSNRYDWSKLGNTQLWGKIFIDKIKLELSATNNLVTNYIYYNDQFVLHQQSEAFSVLQLKARKLFRVGKFYLDNDVVWQKATANAPVNLPDFLLRHKLGIETPMFKSALRVSIGVEARYHTPYFSDGYIPYFNQFYYQNTYKVTAIPECTLYANFKIKSFRAFVMYDQIQHFFVKNIINAPGYPESDANFKFGFKWVLIN
jgi:hypothetical protein